MKRSRSRSLAAMVVALFAVLVLVGCGGQSAQSSSSAAAQSSASGSQASSTGSEVQAATTKAPSLVYVPTKLTIKGVDGLAQTITHTYNEKGQLLTERSESNAPELLAKQDATITAWDEYGHAVASKTTQTSQDGVTSEVEGKVECAYVDASGILATGLSTFTVKKDSFEQDEMASQTVESTYTYGSDVQVLKKMQTTVTYFDQSGKTLSTRTSTREFDEDGLEIHATLKDTSADGTEQSYVLDVTWTKDAGGKPTAFKIESSGDDLGFATITGDVTVDENGLITKLSNFVFDGQAVDSEITIEYQKIDNPLPSAYEGWKIESITEVLVG